MAATQIHGGTQLRDSTVTAAKVTSGIIIAAGSNAFTGDQSMGSHKLTNLADGTSSGDAVNKGQLDAAVASLLDFQGAQDCSGNPNYPSALKGDSYVVSVAGKIGGASGKSVDVGDVFVASADNAGGAEGSVGTSWFVLEHNLVGALLGANNLSELASPATALTNLGGSAIGKAIFTQTDPSAVRYIRINADNTITLRTAAEFAGDISAISGTFVTRETPSGTVNGSNATFTLAHTPTSGSEEIYVNGILQDAGSGNDYQISTDTITFESGAIPQSGDKIRVSYRY